MLVYLFTVSAVIFIPSIQHFIPPLSNCLLADICNHTWIPDCGKDDLGDKRMFIDECDMLEFNCDFNRKYELTNYSDCFGPATGCPTLRPAKSLRIGNYVVMRDGGRKMIYAPTVKTTRHGKRRYTPKPGRKLKTTKKKCYTCKSFTQKPTYKRKPIKITTKSTRFKQTRSKFETVILQRITVMKNGKMMIKIVKGIAPTTESVTAQKPDSDFLE